MNESSGTCWCGNSIGWHELLIYTDKLGNPNVAQIDYCSKSCVEDHRIKLWRQAVLPVDALSEAYP